MQVKKLAAQYEAAIVACRVELGEAEDGPALSRDSVSSAVTLATDEVHTLALPGTVSLLRKRIEAAISTEVSGPQSSLPFTRIPLSLAGSTVSSSISVSPPSPPSPRPALASPSGSQPCTAPNSSPPSPSPSSYRSIPSHERITNSEGMHGEYTNFTGRNNDMEDDDDSVTPVTVDTVFWQNTSLSPDMEWNEDFDDTASSVVRVDDAFSLNGLDLENVDALLEADITPAGVQFSLTLSRSKLELDDNNTQQNYQIPSRTAKRSAHPVQLSPLLPSPSISVPVPPSISSLPSSMVSAREHVDSESNLSASHREYCSRGPAGVSSDTARRLPKAKVMLGRKRPTANGTGSNNAGPSESADGIRTKRESSTASTRRLVREYSHPSELLEGHVSMVVPFGNDDDRQHRCTKRVGSYSNAEARRHAQSRQDDAMRHKMVMNASRNSADYDAFTYGVGASGSMGLSSSARGRVLAEEGDYLDMLGMSGSSKKRYSKRYGVFVGAGDLLSAGNAEIGTVNARRARSTGEEERRKKIAERMERTGLMISGTLDRVSMAADPWIDFITDRAAVPNIADRRPGRRGRIRRAIFRLFGVCNPNTRLLRDDNPATQ